MSNNLIIINDSSELISMEWRVDTCNSGESCWCRLIIPVGNVKFKDGGEAYIAPDGSLSRVEAEHIVKIHNLWLKGKLI